MDPNFAPGSDEYEQQLFQEQQDFLYSVLISSLKTDFSEALVKDHEGDAQLILELLHEHHTGNSQYSRSEINRITKYLTNIKLDDTWRGTNESFLMHYNDQLRLLDSLVDSDEKLPDNKRVTFLESAVESVPDLRRVKITDNVLQAQLDSTRPISYRAYFDLLKDAAFHLDQATKRGNKIRRTNVHFSGPNDEDEHQNLSSDDPQVIQQEDVSSEPPEPLSYSVFQSHFQGSSTSNTQKIFLPKPIWEKLSKDQQQMIIDHNRSLPKSGSSSLSTPNKSPSPLPHKPTPQQTAKSQQVHTHQSDQSTADTTKVETTPSDPLLAMVHQSIHTSADDASDITKVLSAKRSRQIQVCKCYIFQHANHTNNQFVDRGANGGLAGSDMRVIYKTHRKINISGIDNHEVTGPDVVTAATLLNTSLGKVIGIFNEYAYLGKGSSIHSSGQLEWFKTLVDEKSIKVGGTQLITTLDGYSVPLIIRDGLAYATSLGRPTDQDMDTYPHVFFTSPDEWDPTVLDHDPPHLDGLDPSQLFRLLDSLVDSDEKLPDNKRVTFLESAVESVPDLRRVKITDNVLQAQLDSTRPISYRAYFDLLKDAAFHLDQATKRGNKIRRTNVHFSGPNDEDEHQNLSSDDPQVIQQEDVSSEPPEPLSYSVFQSHFQGSSTSNTQKIFLPKPIWEKLSKDQQQMIIDHNRSLPKSGSSSLSTPNKSPSPLPHKPTPQQTAKSQQVHTHQSDQSTADTTKVETTPSDPLLAMVHQSIHTSADDASDITKVLSAKRSRQIQVCKCYIFQHANHTNNQFVDRGANGGLAGSDMRVIYKTHRKINISGIDNHEVTGPDVVTAATLLNTSLGKVIGIFNEYAYLGKGSSIHSSGQLEWFKTLVDEKSIKVGGTQLITTLDGYSVPLIIRDGLAYATSLGRPTDQDMDTYPHVFFTSPDEWDPTVLDHDPPHLDGLDPSQLSDQTFGDPMFDAYGDLNERIIANLNILLDAPPGDCGSYTSTPSVSTVNLHQSSPQEPDSNALRPFFAWTSPSSIKDTFNVTTRHGTAPHTQDYIKKHFKSRNPVFNIPRRSEAVATDTIFSDTPAVDDGSTMAQFFCGCDTLVCDAYGIKSTKQFINTLSDNIRKSGAMDTCISDGGKYEISKRVTDLLRSLFIQDYQSEPYHQHQNKAENRFGLAKRYTNTVMNTSGCTSCCCLLCLQYICVVLNHLASPTLQGICPVQALEGTTPDISFLLHFSFYEPVYYRIDSSEPDLNFPSSSKEKKGYWVGFADNQGDSITWRILTEDTQKIIICSGVRSAL